jgi:hypothetical protein
MDRMPELSERANMETYVYCDKRIIVYDDHRSLLNVLFEARKNETLTAAPNLIYFDLHDDACKVPLKSELLKKIGTPDLNKSSSKQFWSFTEFDLSILDDDWLLTGMELNLIYHAIVIGDDNYTKLNIENLKGSYTSEDGIIHFVHSISHIKEMLSSRGCLGDCLIREDYYKIVRKIFQYNNEKSEDFDEGINPFILDFDLDCFTTGCRGKTYAWPESIFRNEYGDERENFFMQQLIERSSFITICREPKCCGGIGESNKILGYLDKYLFDGCLKTKAML